MILAIDPGSQKTGIALVREDGSLFRKAVVPTEELGAHILRAMDGNKVRAVVMGNGTRHKELKALAEEALKKGGYSITVSLVDEKYTTEMGTQRYWACNPPKGWARFLPKGFRTVPGPVDDYVAWVIGQIYLGIVKAEDAGHKKV